MVSVNIHFFETLDHQGVVLPQFDQGLHVVHLFCLPQTSKASTGMVWKIVFLLTDICLYEIDRNSKLYDIFLNKKNVKSDIQNVI
jgi:hypothetical protein